MNRRILNVSDPLEDAAGKRVLRPGPELLDQADEGALVAGLLGDLVEHVGDAGVGDVAVLGDLQREAGVEDGLEPDPHLEHGRDLLAGEAGPGVGVEVEVEAAGREQLVADHLARTERGPVEELLGLEHLADRCGREPVDASSGGGGCGRHEGQPTRPESKNQADFVNS